MSRRSESSAQFLYGISFTEHTVVGRLRLRRVGPNVGHIFSANIKFYTIFMLTSAIRWEEEQKNVKIRGWKYVGKNNKQDTFRFPLSFSDRK